ncbi:glycosyl transferase family 2 [mine drainage metagenome]|uniref:Glycosyl transferase family 2 n=1 Tax=mine drainage metagenome TaxID=410659 RepID=A0A1J5RK69_9ZZZZ
MTPDRSQSVAVIMTTRNRHDDLTQTLQQLLDLGLGALPIYIIDDASDADVADASVLARFERLQMRRNARCEGLIVNRNELARWAVEDILVSLDDDSCFTSRPDFEALCRRFQEEPRLAGVEFDNFERPASGGSATADAAQVQAYTGFGHAIHRLRFLEIGGYRDYFIHMCEERDFGQRAWAAGYIVQKYKDIQVLHRRTPVARLTERNVFYLCRNTIIFNVSNFGWQRAVLLPGMALSMLLGWRGTQGRRWAALKGIASGLAALLRHRQDYRPMSREQARVYRSLPMS